MVIDVIGRETTEEREQTVSQDETVAESGDLQGDSPVVFRDCGSDI